MDPITILAILTGAVKAGESIAELIGKIREHARQDHELTPEEEAAFDQAILETEGHIWWKPEAE